MTLKIFGIFIIHKLNHHFFQMNIIKWKIYCWFLPWLLPSTHSPSFIICIENNTFCNKCYRIKESRDHVANESLYHLHSIQSTLSETIYARPMSVFVPYSTCEKTLNINEIKMSMKNSEFRQLFVVSKKKKHPDRSSQPE